MNTVYPSNFPPIGALPQVGMSAQAMVDQARPQDGRTVKTLAQYLKNNAVFNALDYDAVADGDTDTPTDNAEAFGRLSDAVNAVPGLHPVTVLFPAGHYKYSDRVIDGVAALSLEFTRPVSVVGPGKLDYTGVLDFLTMGPEGLGVDGNGITHYHRVPYTFDGPTITGGETMRQGIVARSYVVSLRIQNVLMENFGSATGYAVFCQSDNWDTRLHNVTFWTDGIAGSPPRNWVRMNGYRLNGDSDQGQSNLVMTQCQAMNGSGIGIGVYISGVGSRIDASNSIAGFSPNVWVGTRAADARIGAYFESVADSGWRTGIGTPCIIYGDRPGHPDAGGWVRGLKLDGVYANLHNPDIPFAANVRLLGPGDDTVGLQFCTLERPTLEGVAAGIPIVSMNVIPSQIGNSCSGATINGLALPLGMVHTPGVADWNGTDETTLIRQLSSDSDPIKAKRVGVHLEAGETKDVLLPWSRAFANANYTPIVNVYDFNSNARLVAIRGWDTTGVTVRVENTNATDAIDFGLAGIAFLDHE